MKYSLGISNFLEEFSAAAAAKSLQSCPTLCDPIDGSPPGFPVPGSLQARTLEWVAISLFSFLSGMKVKSDSEVAQLCLTLSDPMYCSPPGSPVHGTLQARVLEWGAIAFSELALALLIVVVVSLTECLTPFFPMDCSPPGSPVHGISQARILEWVATSFSRRSS